MVSSLCAGASSANVLFTDLFHSVQRAADCAKPAIGRRTTFVLLLDTVQSTSDVDMEKAGGVPTDQWADALKIDGRLVDLSGVCVVVVGADATSRHGAPVRRFWTHCFDTSGATFGPANYRTMVAGPAEIRCS
jgi:hypothetical protein